MGRKRVPARDIMDQNGKHFDRQVVNYSKKPDKVTVSDVVADGSQPLRGVSNAGMNARRGLRVLIVAPSLAILGGQAVQAARLYSRLQHERSLEIGFLAVNPPLPGVWGGLQRIKYVRTLVTSLAYIAALLTRVRHYECIHVFSASYLSFVLAPTPAILVARLYGKRVVLNYRSGEADDHLRRWGRTALPTLRLAHKIVVPSAYLVEVFKEFGLRADPIFNFVDEEQFPFRERVPLRPVFLSNRNLEPLYNVECTLRAFAIVQKRIPEAQLIVAGDGAERTRLEVLCTQLGMRNFMFVGRVPPSEMPRLYAEADIYLNSPNIDNMPGSVIEAFSSGLPVITTDAGGIPYIVTHEETGLMVRRGDHDAMAAQALRLLRDQAFARKLAGNAHAECRKYAWSAVCRQWLEVYGAAEATQESGPPGHD